MNPTASKDDEEQSNIQYKVEQFLFHEARLLDTHQLDDWLSLFAESGRYWVPLTQNQPDPFEHSSIIYDDLTLLKARVNQYKHPRAHARIPLTRTTHQISNVMVLSSDSDFIQVSSTLVLIEYRQERQKHWGALVEHKLLKKGNGFLIDEKRIELVNSEAELDGITVIF
jgi:benzoate/toluate 1,2-dioxygenase beta subunit